MKKISTLFFMALGLCLVTFTQACKDDEKEPETAPATGVTLSKDSLTLAAGAKETLTATVQPSTAAQTVTWSTTAPAIAAVANGEVTALAEGVAKIVATTTEGGFTDTCVVTVTAASDGPTATEWEVDSTYLEGGIWYKVVRAGELAVVANPAGQDYSGTINVPSTVNDDYTVKYIAHHAFAGAEDVEYVNLPSTIVSLGNCAFQNAVSLKSIVIPNLVTALSDDDFDGVDNEDMVGATFMNCISLEEVTIGAGVTNLAFVHGLFNNNDYDWTSSLKKLTILAPNPPAINGNSFMLSVDNAVLFVPADAVEAYQDAFGGTEGIWMWTHGAAKIYAVGTCVPPWGLSVDENNVITWAGVASGGYDVVVSSTELSNPTGSTHVGSESYNASDDIQQDGAYYIYVRGACSDNSSEWVSTSKYQYSGAYCNYNVSGITTYTNDSGEPDTTYWTSSVELWQNGFPIATVAGEAAFDGATVQLIPNVEVTVKWVGGSYPDACTLFIKQGETEILSDENLVDNTSNDNVGTFTPSCSN